MYAQIYSKKKPDLFCPYQILIPHLYALSERHRNLDKSGFRHAYNPGQRRDAFICSFEGVRGFSSTTSGQQCATSLTLNFVVLI